MAFEVSCSQCQGRLMVEQAGQVVACPHCGVHLAIPEAAPSDVPPTDAPADFAPTDIASGDEPASISVQVSEAEATPEAEAILTQPPPEDSQTGDHSAIETPIEAPALPQDTPGEMPVFSPASESTDGKEQLADTVDNATNASVDVAAEPTTISVDDPFLSSAPDFSSGFGGVPASDDPFAGGDFNFGHADVGNVTTVSEFVPTAPPGDSDEAPEISPAAPESASDSTESLPRISDESQSAPGEANPVETGVPELTADTDAGSQEEDVAAAVPTAASANAQYQPTFQPPTETVPRSKYVLVLSWASSATIAALFLAYLLTTSQTSQLESLPDVKPPKKDDKIVYKLVPEDAAMPPGHVLALGETQRYGNLKVTALRVTRGPIQFEHYDTSSKRTRDDGPEVLKLWLKFENVSRDQSIAPLDELVFQRDDRDFENVRANIFLARTSFKEEIRKWMTAKKQKQEMERPPCLVVYDLNTSDDWNLKGQQVTHEIPPGGQLETYIPTTPEGISDVLTGDEELVWRVHFRKGYSRKNYGVTTVIEVTFNGSDVMSDSAAPAASTPTAAGNDSHKA
jgi:hypothetical protein